MSIKINIGCGQTPTQGWKNYDNSWSVRLAQKPFLTRMLVRAKLLSDLQRQFISVVQENNIMWANAVERIPEQDDSVDVLYSSHMMEHIEKQDARLFLNETRRVLKPGGIVRIAVPDIHYHVENYLSHGDADEFIKGTLLTKDKPRTILQKVKYLIFGDRHHLWMYDGKSLCQLLSEAGFKDPTIMAPGTTTIKKPGDLNLQERAPESVFVEGVK